MTNIISSVNMVPGNGYNTVNMVERNGTGFLKIFIISLRLGEFLFQKVHFFDLREF